MSGLAQELDPCVRSNRYYNADRARKALSGQESLGLLRPNFQLFYKRINYHYLITFDQIES